MPVFATEDNILIAEFASIYEAEEGGAHYSVSGKRENFLFMGKDETENFFEMECKIIFEQWC